MVPYLREIMDAISDPTVTEMVVMKSAQVGFTEGVLNNAIGYYIHQDPSSVIVVQPSDYDAEDWSKTRLAPMLRDTPCLVGLVREARSRDSDNTIRDKAYPGGRLKVTGATSPKGLRRTPARVGLLDEIDGYPPSAGTEGDPIGLVRRRLTTFWNRKLVLGSSPTLKGLSRIERAFALSDQRYYHVCCPHCGHRQVLRWGGRDADYGLKWERGKPDTASYLCAECGVLIDEKEKRGMVEAGQWVPTRPEHTIPGWHINALISLFDGARWPHIATEFEAVHDNPEQLQVFVNTVLGEVWELRGERLSGSHLEARVESYAAAVPAGVGVLTMGVDVHGDRIEAVIRGWGAGEESWLIGHHRIYGDPEMPEPWQRLEALRVSPYSCEVGGSLRVRACMIDSGYLTTAVYQYVRPRQGQGVSAAKGVQEQRGLAPLARSRKPNRQGIRLWTIGTGTLKDTLFARLRVERPGPRYMHFCPPTDTGGDAEYFAQFESEVVVSERVQGRHVRRYRQVRVRNEAIDLEVLALAALGSLGAGVRDHLDRWVAAVAEAGQSSTPSVDRTPPPPPRSPEEETHEAPHTPRRRGFVHRWRP